MARTPDQGRQEDGRRAALAPYIGKWVALESPTEVLVAADTPEEVLEWLKQHGARASYGMFQVPGQTADGERVLAHPGDQIPDT